MHIKPDTETIAKNIQPGMVVDTLEDGRITVYSISVSEPTREIELVDHRGTPTILPFGTPVVVRGYFNVD
jgi:hypothetical protein